MASEALRRAGKALYDDVGIQRELPFSDLPLSMQESYSQMAGVANRAALDPMDAALVEAMAKAMRLRFGVAWRDTENLDECDPEVAAEHREDAIAAIIAARRHITGDTT